MPPRAQVGFGPGFFCTLFCFFLMLPGTALPAMALKNGGGDDQVSLQMGGNP